MKSVQELVSEHCPEGVERRALGQIGQFIRGQGLQKVDFVDDGEPCIHYGQIYTFYKKYVVETKSFVTPALKSQLKTAPSGSLIITTTSENIPDVARAVVWLGPGEVVFGGHSCAFTHNENPKYLAYALETSEFQARKNALVQGTKVKDISLTKLAGISIPVPPRIVQDSIVSILDKFYELEVELEAELDARRKQFVHYRKQLLSFDTKEVTSSRIGSLVTVVRTKKIIPRSKYETAGQFPIIDQGQSFIAGWTHDESAIIPSGDYVVFGDHTRSLKYVNFPFAQGADGLQILKAAEGVDPRYLFHAISSLDLPNRGYNRHWTLVREIEVPLPNLESQLSISLRLDEFDSLVNDPSFGIPGEIEARRKQYEYYRDQLLAFKEA